MNKVRILLVEDDQLTVRAYRDGLENAGFEVLVALDGNNGINRAIRENPDIILLDLLLPEKDGFAVLEEIRHNPKTNKIPIIILTNVGQEYDVKKGKELGADDYLIKVHHSMQDVIERIKFHLNKNTQSE